LRVNHRVKLFQISDLLVESALMRHQNHSFLEPSAVRNLERVFKGYTSHKELQGYSSKPRPYVCRRRGDSLMAQTRHGANLEDISAELGVTRERVR